MTINVTITKPGVTDQFGRAMTVGTTYAVEDNFGLSLISQLKATDTGNSLVTPGITQDDPLSIQYVNAAAIAAPTAQMLRSYSTVFVLNASPYTRYRTNGTILVPEAQYTLDASGNITGLVGVSNLWQDAPSTGYFCHLYAPNQSVCDPYFADISGALNHGTLGANLSKAELWASAGFASTLAGSADEVIHLPALNFDFAGGESMLFMWKGKITAPASALPFIGNSAGSSSKGICPMRILTDGTCQGYISSGTASFFDITGVVADGTVHSFAVLLDGFNSKYATYVDGVVARSLIAITSRDTVNTNQFMVGNTQASIWGAATSLVSGTQALVILRGRTGLGLPSDYDALVKALMSNPGKLVTRQNW